MARLLVCLCKDDEKVSEAAQSFKSQVEYSYFGARLTGIKGLLRMVKVDVIIVTAHGNEDEMGNESSGFIDIDPKTFAKLLTECNFTGTIYLDICDGYLFGQNLKQHLKCAGIYGAEGSTDMKIDISTHKRC